jgi:threonine 3-dehydrogenase
VAVIGCGPIGLFAVGIARALGAWKVIAIEPNDERRQLASKMGADLLVDPKAEDTVEVVLRETEGAGAEVVLEMSGNARAIDQGTRMLARGGRMSLLGLPDRAVTLDLTDQVIFKEARILGITGREMFRTWQQTTTLLSTGRVDVTPVITHRFPLSRFEEAFETTASGRAAKVIVFPGAPVGGE